MILLSTDERCREQHEIIRNSVGVYYFTHQLIEVTGADAAALLDRLYVSSIGKLVPGRGRYTMLLDEAGIPQDDCVVFCLAPDKYWISTLHAPRTEKALAAQKGELNAAFERVTKKWDMYAVQGPKAEALTKSAVRDDPSALKRFQIMDSKLGEIPVKVARGGYTGEAGYEIYCAAEDTEAVKAALCAALPDFGGGYVDEFDVVAYTLATEAGFPLVTDIDDATPFETDMDWLIDWNKPEFIGRESVLAAKDKPRQKKLVGVTVDEPFTKVHGGPYGAPVYKDGRQIGRITKFTYGFTVGKWVGFALIDADSAVTGDHVVLNWDVDAVITERSMLK